MMNLYDFFEGVIMGIKETSWVELAAVITGIIYVFLAARKSIWCWLFALISSSLYIILLLSARLYLESGLNFFYVVMAIFGWLSWRDTINDRKDIISWKFTHHLINIVLSGLAAVLLGWLFDAYTDQANPYVDATTTVFSLTATYMVTKKVLENWIYWIVIDGISIWLYAQRGLNMTTLLFLLYTIIAVAGFITWWQQYKSQRT